MYNLAKKLPQTATPSSRAGGAGRSSAPGGRAGVDLNKQANVGQNEACNC
jgi:Ras-related protein Rab-5C